MQRTACSSGRPRLTLMQQEPDFQASRASLWRDASESDTWQHIVSRALATAGGTASLSMLYALIERHPKTASRKHWRAKVRQVLQASEAFVRVDDGLWSQASGHSAAEIARYNALRRTRYPRASETSE